MIDNAIVDLLRTHAGCSDRIYSGGQKVENTQALPKVVYTWLGGDGLYCDDGNVGLVKGRYQLDIFAATPTAARTIADAIRNGMDGHASTIDTTKIERIYFPDRGQVHKPETQVGQSAAAARFSQDLLVDYREPVS